MLVADLCLATVNYQGASGGRHLKIYVEPELRRHFCDDMFRCLFPGIVCVDSGEAVNNPPGLEGPFTLLTLPAPIPDIGYTEGPAGTLYVEDRDRVRYWTLRFGMLTQRALSCQESAELIAEAMHNYE